VSVPTVFVSITAFGDLLDVNLAAGKLQSVAAAMADSLGTDTSLVIVTSEQYVLQSIVALPSSNVSDAVRTAVAAVFIKTGASSTQVLGMSATSRRLLALEVTVASTFANYSAMAAFNTTLTAAVANGSFSASLQQLGVRSAAYLPVRAASGAQFSFMIQCPGGTSVGGTVLPDVTAVLQGVSQTGIDAYTGFHSELDAAGLGVIDSVVVTRLPVASAHRSSG
jgi:hypothetical protein